MSDKIDDLALKAEIASDNEKAKLEATALNNVGVGIFLAGVVGPIVAWLYKLSSTPDVSGIVFVFGGVAWCATSLILNRVGQIILDDIR